MNGLFSPDGSLMQALTGIFNMMWLNILTLICCLPIVTIGPALTAEAYVLTHIIRGEDSYIARQFFRSFKENFRQGTLMWLIYLVLIIAGGADFMILREAGKAIPVAVLTVFLVVVLILVSGIIYSFALLSRYRNTIFKTMKNGWLLALANFPRTLAMLLVIGVVIYLTLIWWTRLLPLLLMFGFTLPGYVVMYLMDGIFKKVEKQEVTKDGGEEASSEEKNEK
jgi:uncharacterized membrane protein YesL